VVPVHGKLDLGVHFAQIQLFVEHLVEGLEIVSCIHGIFIFIIKNEFFGVFIQELKSCCQSAVVGVAASKDVVLGFLRITILKSGCQVRNVESFFGNEERKKFLTVLREVFALVEVVEAVSNEAEFQVQARMAFKLWL